MLIAYLSLALWSAVLIGFAPSAWRYLRSYNLVDSYRTGMFFTAALWIAGVARLIWLPSADDVRAGVLVMSCGLAVYLLILARQGAIR